MSLPEERRQSGGGGGGEQQGQAVLPAQSLSGEEVSALSALSAGGGEGEGEGRPWLSVRKRERGKGDAQQLRGDRGGVSLQLDTAQHSRYTAQHNRYTAVIKTLHGAQHSTAQHAERRTELHPP